jgi:hypothetical protein
MEGLVMFTPIPVSELFRRLLPENPEVYLHEAGSKKPPLKPAQRPPYQPGKEELPGIPSQRPPYQPGEKKKTPQ